MKALFRALAALILAAALGGCTGPTYKVDLGKRIMKLEENELDTGFRNKMQAAREVSGGRPGFAAGGGCGCGN